MRPLSSITSFFRRVLPGGLGGRTGWRKHTRVTNRYKSKMAPLRHNRLCIFSHYDRWKRVDPHVIYYLSRLREAGCDIIMISTCTSLHAEDRGKALKYCSEIITRDNHGYDFGSYCVGLDLMSVEISVRYRQVVLCNDSVYGPFSPLDTIFNAMDARSYDAWGMTESYQKGYHLQSYFMVIDAAALQLPRIKSFWQNMKFDLNKEQVIKQCEIGFTKTLARSHLKIGAWCEYHKAQHSSVRLWQRHMKGMGNTADMSFDAMAILGSNELRRFACQAMLDSCNPTHHFWEVLLQEHAFPFLKVALVKDNPASRPNLIHLPEILSGITSYPISLIWDHRKRIG